MTPKEDEPKVTWGTASLKSGFSGIIRVSEIMTSEKSFGDKPPADQLHWVIEPTSYEAESEEKWPQAWYNISDSAKSKWAKLQESLEALKCLPKTGAEDLIGLEFEFERIDMSFGTNREGVQMEAKGVLMPKKLLRDTKKTKGGAQASSAPSSSAQEQVEVKKVEKKVEKEETTEKIDLEDVILQSVQKEPIVLTDYYKRMNKEFGVMRADVFRAAKSLEKKGKVKFDSEGGVLVKVAE